MVKKEANWSMRIEIMSQLHRIHYPAFVWNSLVFGRLCACSLSGFFIFLPCGDNRFKRFFSAEEVFNFLNRQSLDAPLNLEEISQDLFEMHRKLSIGICPTEKDEQVLRPLISKWEKIVAPIAV